MLQYLKILGIVGLLLIGACWPFILARAETWPGDRPPPRPHTEIKFRDFESPGNFTKEDELQFLRKEGISIRGQELPPSNLKSSVRTVQRGILVLDSTKFLLLLATALAGLLTYKCYHRKRTAGHKKSPRSFTQGY